MLNKSRDKSSPIPTLDEITIHRPLPSPTSATKRKSSTTLNSTHISCNSIMMERNRPDSCFQRQRDHSDSTLIEETVLKETSFSDTLTSGNHHSRSSTTTSTHSLEIKSIPKSSSSSKRLVNNNKSKNSDTPQISIPQNHSTVADTMFPAHSNISPIQTTPLDSSFLDISQTEDFSQIETALEDFLTDLERNMVTSASTPSLRPKSSSSGRSKDPKRIQQNREAQRNFRERRKAYIKELEEKLVRLESIASEAEDVRANLKRAEERITQLTVEKESWRQERQIWVAERHEIMKMLVHLSAQFSPMMALNSLFMNPMMPMNPFDTISTSSFGVDAPSSFLGLNVDEKPKETDSQSNSVINVEEENRPFRHEDINDPVTQESDTRCFHFNTDTLASANVSTGKQSSALFPPKLQTMLFEQDLDEEQKDSKIEISQPTDEYKQSSKRFKLDDMIFPLFDTQESSSLPDASCHSQDTHIHGTKKDSNLNQASASSHDQNLFASLFPKHDFSAPTPSSDIGNSLMNPLAAYAASLFGSTSCAMNGATLSPEDIMICMHQFEQQRSSLSLAVSSSLSSTIHSPPISSKSIDIHDVNKYNEECS